MGGAGWGAHFDMQHLHSNRGGGGAIAMFEPSVENLDGWVNAAADRVPQPAAFGLAGAPLRPVVARRCGLGMSQAGQHGRTLSSGGLMRVSGVQGDNSVNYSTAKRVK